MFAAGLPITFIIRPIRLFFTLSTKVFRLYCSLVIQLKKVKTDSSLQHLLKAENIHADDSQIPVRNNKRRINKYLVIHALSVTKEQSKYQATAAEKIIKRI